jgi:hypothetical protein
MLGVIFIMGKLLIYLALAKPASPGQLYHFIYSQSIKVASKNFYEQHQYKIIIPKQHK